MSSWTDKELERLCDPMNHKIVSDGFDYRWYHKLNGKWEIHSIKVFEDYEKPYSWLQYWLSNWSKELTQRRKNYARNKQKITNRIKRISEMHDHSTHQKVLRIHSIDPSLTNQEIGLELNISDRMVRKYISDTKW